MDFVNLEKKVVVELDGRQHGLDPNDRIRDEWLRAKGIGCSDSGITRYSVT